MRVPAHGVTQTAVGMEERSQNRFGPALQDGLRQLHPDEHAPRRHVSGRQHLMLVVPLAAICFDHLAVGCDAEERRPAVRRHVEQLHLIGIVGEKLSHAAPVVGVGLLLEADDPGCHRQDAVLAQQPDRCAIGWRRRALADEVDGLGVGAFHAEQEALPAGLLVEMQIVGVAHDVVGTCRTDEDDVDFFGDQRLEERDPGAPGDGRVLIGKIEDLDAVLAIEACDLGGKADRITVPPSGPEAALAAVVAKVRAASRELNDDGAKPAPVAVVGVVDQFPADAIGVEIGDDGCSARCNGLSIAAQRDTVDAVEWTAAAERRHHLAGRRLAFAAHDGGNVGLAVEDLPPEVGRIDATIDDR